MNDFYNLDVGFREKYWYSASQLKEMLTDVEYGEFVLSKLTNSVQFSVSRNNIIYQFRTIELPCFWVIKARMFARDIK